jgi:FdhD protein
MTTRDPSPTFTAQLTNADGKSRPASWRLAEETPAAILYNGQFFAVMMVTPADLEDFVVGFTITEAIVDNQAEILGVRVAEANDGFALNVRIPPERLAGIETRRRVLTGRSGCGICGAQTLDAAVAPPRAVKGHTPPIASISRAFRELPGRQLMNRDNHSTHAAAFATEEGIIRLAREDVGRHNALDKLIGAVLRAGLDPSSGFIVVSSRCSMELVQKAAVVGVPFLASVSAPTALAARLARESGMGIAARSGDGFMLFGGDGRKEDR